MTESKSAFLLYLRNFVNLCPDPMLIVDVSGLIVGANEQASRLLQYDSVDLVGLPIDLFVPDSQRPGHASHRASFFTEPKLRPMGKMAELQVKTKYGEYIPVEISLGFFEPADEEIVAVCTLRDVTQRKQIDRLLKESNEKLIATFKSIGDGLVVTDAAGRITHLNAVAEEYLGLAENIARGKQFEPLLGLGQPFHVLAKIPYVDPSVAKHITKFLTTLKLEGQQRRIVNVSAGPITVDGALSGLVLVLHDITEHVEFERRLVASERQLSDIVEALPDGIVIHENSLVIYANRAFCRSVGFDTRFDVLGKSLMSVIPGFTNSDDVGPAREIYSSRCDGSAVTLEVSGAHEIQINGQAGVLQVIRDISLQKRLQASLASSDRLASVGLLAAGVAHEINNPLTYIIMNQQFALEKFDAALEKGVALDLGDVREAISEALEGSERVRSIVTDLKSASSQVEHSEQQLVDLVAAMESSLRMATFETQHIRVKRDFAKSISILGNRAKLGQLFTNLLTNAAHALQAGNHSSPLIHVSIYEHDGDAVIEIADNGPGIPVEILPRIFDPFFTSKEAGKGTGLGLFVSHAIVKAHGGSLAAGNGLGGMAAVFTIRIPLQSKLAPASNEAIAVADTNIKPLHDLSILIIEDEPAIAKLMKRSFHGHRVTVTHGGYEAIALLESGEQFDAVFCDAIMKHGTGFEVRDYVLHNRPELLGIFIFMTGETFHFEWLDRLGPLQNPILAKPFSLDALHAALNSLGRKASQRD